MREHGTGEATEQAHRSALKALVEFFVTDLIPDPDLPDKSAEFAVMYS